jgi:hypothetical protein
VASRTGSHRGDPRVAQGVLADLDSRWWTASSCSGPSRLSQAHGSPHARHARRQRANRGRMARPAGRLGFRDHGDHLGRTGEPHRRPTHLTEPNMVTAGSEGASTWVRPASSAGRGCGVRLGRGDLLERRDYALRWAASPGRSCPDPPDPRGAARRTPPWVRRGCAQPGTASCRSQSRVRS